MGGIRKKDGWVSEFGDGIRKKDGWVSEFGDGIRKKDGWVSEFGGWDTKEGLLGELVWWVG